MTKRRMATEAISDHDLLKLLIADKYQHRNPQMGIDPDDYIRALSRREGSIHPSESEDEVREMYDALLDAGIDPSQQGAIEHGSYPITTYIPELSMDDIQLF